jgi:C4-dicarboxylate-specific signal transduction histidine kinase
MANMIRLSKRAVALRGLTAAAAIAIFIVGTITSLDIAVATLYVAVILVASRFLRPRGIAMVGLGAMALTLLAWYLSAPRLVPVETAINELISMAAIGLVTILALKGKRSEAALLDSERCLRDAQLALVHANRLTTMGELVASISHEMKQPITGITCNASTGLRWLAHDAPDMRELRQVFDRIVRDAGRAVEVIKRVQGLVKKAPACSETLQINEAIREVMALMASDANGSGVSVRMRLSEDLPFIKGDRVQLQQVVLNLVINAIDAMSAIDGLRELTISTAMKESAAVLVTVRDSGPGVAPEHVERLFEPFYTTKASGMGMGLSISRTIIEAHGGRLWASATLAHGAVFQFTVPVRPAVSA